MFARVFNQFVVKNCSKRFFSRIDSNQIFISSSKISSVLSRRGFHLFNSSSSFLTKLSQPKQISFRMVHKVVDKDDLASQLTAAGDKLVVIDFYATWCGPCRMIAPVLEKLSTDHKDTLVVLKIDVDENEEITSEYGVSSMPTFVFLKFGKKITTFSGANEAKLRETIQANM